MTTYEKNMLRNVLWLLGRGPLPARPEVTSATGSDRSATRAHLKHKAIKRIIPAKNNPFILPHIL